MIAKALRVFEPVNQHRLKTQKAFALVTALVFLVVLTLIGVSMLRGQGLAGKMTGNFREKSRAFEAAQAALQYGEWWVAQGSGTAPVSCSTIASVPRVCNNPLSNPVSLPWSTGSTYNPTGLTIATSGQGTYASAPMYYIYELGTDTSGNMLYRINSVGYGGNTQSVVVLQSVYVIPSGSGGMIGLGH